MIVTAALKNFTATGSLVSVIKSLIFFLRNTYGIVNNPYVTYRKLAEGKQPARQIGFIITISFIYFVYASLIRSGSGNPFVLTLKLNALTLTAGIAFAGTVMLFWSYGRIFHPSLAFKPVLMLWSYTLIPTVIWFFTTSLLYLLLPPPRTFSVPGKAYSILYVSFSIALLYWKVILYYLTARFALRLDLIKIIILTIIYIPLVSLFGILSYRAGIFRIPFI